MAISSMHSSYVRSPSPPDSQPPRQDKKVLQRLYREKEGESFNALRDAIKDRTGEELQTRQEILRKATELIYRLNIGNLGDIPVQSGSGAPLEVSHNYEGMVVHPDHPVQSSDWYLQSTNVAGFETGHYPVDPVTFPAAQPYTNPEVSGIEFIPQDFEGNWPTYY